MCALVQSPITVDLQSLFGLFHHLKTFQFSICGATVPVSHELLRLVLVFARGFLLSAEEGFSAERGRKSFLFSYRGFALLQPPCACVPFDCSQDSPSEKVNIGYPGLILEEINLVPSLKRQELLGDRSLIRGKLLQIAAAQP
jgi:hypothetical protein